MLINNKWDVNAGLNKQAVIIKVRGFFFIHNFFIFFLSYHLGYIVIVNILLFISEFNKKKTVLFTYDLIVDD